MGCLRIADVCQRCCQSWCLGTWGQRHVPELGRIVRRYCVRMAACRGVMAEARRRLELRKQLAEAPEATWRQRKTVSWTVGICRYVLLWLKAFFDNKAGFCGVLRPHPTSQPIMQTTVIMFKMTLRTGRSKPSPWCRMGRSQLTYWGRPHDLGKGYRTQRGGSRWHLGYRTQRGGSRWHFSNSGITRYRTRTKHQALRQGSEISETCMTSQAGVYALWGSKYVSFCGISWLQKGHQASHASPERAPRRASVFQCLRPSHHRQKPSKAVYHAVCLPVKILENLSSFDAANQKRRM